MKEYRVVEGSSNLEYQINKAARDGFRPILMVANGEELVTVLMEKELTEPGAAR